MEKGNFVGEQIQGLPVTAFKARARNSDIPAGKRGGYRLIYQVLSPTQVVLVIIYAKSDRGDISAKEISNILKDTV